MCCISQSNQQQCRYDQSSGGELEGAKALLLTLVTTDRDDAKDSRASAKEVNHKLADQTDFTS